MPAAPSSTPSKGRYRGRFAPTPSGPLHLGSLTTALGSYLQARSLNGRWLIRIDDLDGPRVVPGAEDMILRQLEAHGLAWDEPPRRQSTHAGEYLAALDRLRAGGLVYACICTRAELRGHVAPGHDEPVYGGRCRDAGHPERGAALRLRMPGEVLAFDDAGLGRLERRLDRELGDFVLRRRDGQIAYQLASSVDEAAQDISEVVRGADLVSSTFRQIHLMQRLGLPVPDYRHLPLLVGADGRKLSKQNHAAPIDADRASGNLVHALRCLGQDVPEDAVHAAPRTILEHAVRHWSPARIAGVREISA